MGVSICSDRELRVIDKGGKRGKNMEIGNKIKEARNGAGLTQDQAAEKIMVSRQT
ncbi:MAG: helix-turn-helix transcriptional regulator, partial [Coprococcus sp.]